MGLCCGIDFGTTYSAISWYDEVDNRVETVDLNSAGGQRVMRSAVYFPGPDQGPVVGQAAWHARGEFPDRVIHGIKRSMGLADAKIGPIDGVEYTPEDIAAIIIKALVKDASDFLGEEITDVAIAVPAYFSASQVVSVKKAGELAGLNVIEIVKEPVAAAVYFGIEKLKDGDKFMICDLGGGTFDATIITLERGQFTCVATKGDRHLGGHDWTMELVVLVAERYLNQSGEDARDDPVAAQALYEACERAKCSFTQLTETMIGCTHKGRIEQIQVTRDEFEARTEPLVGRMAHWCQESLAQAVMTWNDIDRILLVGGSTRLCSVSRALEEASGKKPTMAQNPDLAVALGAAMMAAGRFRPRGGLVAEAREGALVASGEPDEGGLFAPKLYRTTPRRLGTRVYNPERSCLTNVAIVPGGTVVPVSRSSDGFMVSRDGQEYFDLPVVEFESDDEYEGICSYRCKCLPSARRGDQIRVTFHYDVSGIVSAEAHDVATEQQLQMEALPYNEPELSHFAEAPKARWVVFALDVSYSMEGEMLDNAKQALCQNARDVMAAEGDACKIGVVTFASSAEVVCRPTSDLSEIERQVRSMKCSGTTAMDEGISEAVILVMSAPAGTDRDVVLLTDGMPDGGREQSTRDAAEDAKRKGVTLSSLAIGEEGVDMDYLRSLTPLMLQIRSADEIANGVATLLTRAKKMRDGLITEDSGRQQPEPDIRPKPYLDENVQFTVYRPKVVQPEKWYDLLAFAHLSERRADAPPDEPDPIQQVREVTERVLGEQVKDYGDVVVDSREAIPQESQLTFVPQMRGVEFNPAHRTFRWTDESVHKEEFKLRASAELDGMTARGQMAVYLGSILIADIPLAIRVDSSAEAESKSLPMETVAARPYRKIFASYSHLDEWVVLEFERYVQTMGDRYLRDCRNLRGGEVWCPRLAELIEEADVFQLFWSTNSMDSPFVRQEWEHALGLSRPNFIRPVYWEEPMPQRPKEGMPPEALSRLQFEKLGGGCEAHLAPVCRMSPVVAPEEQAATEPGAVGEALRDLTGDAHAGTQEPPPAAKPPPPPPSADVPVAVIAEEVETIPAPEGGIRDRIVVLGRRGAGKTVYLAALYARLYKSLDGLTMRAVSDPAHRDSMRIVAKLAHGEWPPATQDNTLMEVRISDKGHERQMVSMDYSGEEFRRAFIDEDYERPAVKDLLGHIDRAGALILLLDPATVFSHKGDIDAAVDVDFGMLQAVLRVRHSPGGEDVPIAIVLTKMDENMDMVMKEGGAKSFVKNHWPALLAELKQLWIFKVSGVQTTKDAEGNLLPRADSIPTNLENPLKYCLQKMAENEQRQDIYQAEVATMEAGRLRREMANKETARWKNLWIAVIIAMLLLGAFICGIILVYG